MSLALGRDVGIGLRVNEEEVVQDELVEVAGRELRDLLDVVAIRGVGVAVGGEQVRLVLRERAARSHLNAAVGEELLHLLKERVIRHHPVAVHLDVNLVDLHLAADQVPLGLKDLRVGEAVHLPHCDIDGDVKVLVVACSGQGERGHARNKA
jgi:hypothetical protein